MAYITLQGSHIRIQAGRLIVESKDNIKVLDAPTGHVARIVCFGSMGVSAGARTWALSEDVELVFISRRGGYLGQMMPACSPRRVGRLRAQLRAAADLDLAVGFGRAVVEAKVRKQMVLLQRLGRRDTSEVVAASVHQMRQSLLHLPHCSNTAEVMGIEGASAKAYFSGLGAIVPHEVAFVGRSRQPPQDLINAALSYGYAILLSECVSALTAAGLDPAIGLLRSQRHQAESGPRPDGGIPAPGRGPGRDRGSAQVRAACRARSPGGRSRRRPPHQGGTRAGHRPIRAPHAADHAGGSS